MSKLTSAMIEAMNELEKENHQLRCNLGDLRDLIAELVVDIEASREPVFLEELVVKYRQLYPKQ